MSTTHLTPQTQHPLPISPTMGSRIHYSKPTNPLLRCLLQMLQGLPSSLFHWDPKAGSFFLTHPHHSHLSSLLSPFIHSSNCLNLVQLILSRVGSCAAVPTLRAFASSASLWLQRLRGIALKEEEKVCESRDGVTPTLLELSISLSSVFSGAEYLFQLVNGAIPPSCFEPNSGVTAAEIAVDILDYLYKKLGEVCLVQHGKDEAYLMVLYLFVGSVLPCIEGLDSWLFEGTLDDPFEEMFFYANKAITVDESEFWEKSYQLRQVRFQKLNTTPSMVLAGNNKGIGERDSTSMPISSKAKEANRREHQLCPMFLKDIAMSVVSAGKSLQLIRHVAVSSVAVPGKGIDSKNDGFTGFEKPQEHIAGLTLPEIFCLSVAGLIGHGDHIFRNFVQDELFSCETTHFSVPDMSKVVKDEKGQDVPPLRSSEKFWHKLFTDTLAQRKVASNEEEIDLSGSEREFQSSDSMDELISSRSFIPENPVVTVCRNMLAEDRQSWKMLNLSRNFHLPPLNDEALRDALFGGDHVVSSALKGTNYSFGFQFGKSEYLRLHDDIKMLEALFPFPTLLPMHQDNVRMSELLPSQKNSTLTSRVLSWIQSIEPKMTPLPVVIVHECLTVYIKKQVDYIGRVILTKLMNDWRLMDELTVLRAIYLLGSGDLLQHFFTVVFNKLDKGETWDDEFELNTILQESIWNSADAQLLSAPDLLVVSVDKHHGHDDGELPGTPTLAAAQWKLRPPSNGIDGLESLKFTYKVPWPLELIANIDAVKKYNKVMGFLVKVKRAKFVLDKTRRWMWKGQGKVTNSIKRQWLVEQKLLHFVDAFHQYVMDRVYHSAWRELCKGMAAAGSLDEVIEVHEAYLLSIQRQCFVVSDKFWAMIGSRINNILGLALEFYSIQQTLSSGGAGSAMKARCEMEVDRIEKQFDERIAFLLRVLSSKLNVGHFPHLADLVTRINYNCFYMSDA